MPLVRSDVFKLTVPLAVAIGLLGLALAMDRLPLPAVRSVAPAAGVLSIVMFPFVARRTRWTPLSVAIAVFAAYALVHSVAMVTYDIVTGDGDRERAVSWGRQVASLGIGLMIFVVFRAVFVRANGKELTKWLLWGAAPVMAVSFVQVLAWVLHVGVAVDLVVFVRETLLGLNPMAGRVTGLAVEPASYAGYAAAAVLPLAGAAVFMTGRPRAASLLLAVGALSLIFTFSGIGYTLILAVCLGFVVMVPPKYRLVTVIGIAVFIGGVVAVLKSNPNSYLLNVIDEHVAATEALEGGEVTTLDKFASLARSGVGTIATKVGSTVDPLTHMGSSRVAFGYGLGGSEIHGREFLSDETLAAYNSAGGGFRLSLKTLAGRIVAELGIIGLVLALFLLFVALRQATKLLRAMTDGPVAEAVPLVAARVGLVVCLIGVLITIGSFALPYIWLWLAVIDSRDLRQQQSAVAATSDASNATPVPG